MRARPPRWDGRRPGVPDRIVKGANFNSPWLNRSLERMNMDVVVVGLGAMGSATSYQLAKKGVKVVGIDRFSPPHGYGSTHGDTRITRQAIGEGRAYIPLALRSHELWREIEAETGADLFTACGGLILTGAEGMSGQHGISDFFAETVSAAEAYGIEHELLTVDDVRDRFPQFRLPEDRRCYFEPGAGFVRPEAAIAAQLELAQHHDGVVRKEERVLDIEPASNEVIVRTDKDTYRAKQVVISAGPWISQLVGSDEIARLFSVYPQFLHWFDTDDVSTMTPDRTPVYIWEFGPNEDDIFYGFPAIDGPSGGVKVATEQYRVKADPDDLSCDVDPEESQTMFDHCVDGRLPLRRAIVKSARCLYTVTPDQKFIIDRHPEHENIILASPCSGHGFKHSAAIGEALAELTTEGRSTIDLSAFSLGRFRGDYSAASTEGS
jgi:sarcosine oxidase